MKKDPYYLPAGWYNMLEFVTFEPALGHFYWLKRAQWGENAVIEGRIRSFLGNYYGRHNVKFHDLAATDLVGLQFHISKGWDNYEVICNLTVTNSRVLACHTSEVINQGPFSDGIFQVVYME